jgi:hypothetical protein
VSDRLGSEQPNQVRSAKDLSSRLFEGYFYYLFYLSIGPMLDAGEV